MMMISLMIILILKSILLCIVGCSMNGIDLFVLYARFQIQMISISMIPIQHVKSWTSIFKRLFTL